MKHERQHPPWANPPYPDRPPTRFAMVLIRMTEWLMRLLERQTRRRELACWHKGHRPGNPCPRCGR